MRKEAGKRAGALDKLPDWNRPLRVASNPGVPTDVTVAFTLSLKAAPSMSVGEDATNRCRLVGE